MLQHEALLSSVDVGGERWTTMGGRLRRLDDFWEQLDRVMRRLGGATRARVLSSLSSRGPAADAWLENAGSRQFVEGAFTPLIRASTRCLEFLHTGDEDFPVAQRPPDDIKARAVASLARWCDIPLRRMRSMVAGARLHD